MPIIFQIALRNVREHKMKSIIICSLIALGMFLLVLGNSIIDTSKVGIKKSFVQSSSGDILVGPLDKDKNKPAVFRPGSPEVEAARPTVPDYQNNYQYLKDYPDIAQVEPQIFGSLVLDISDDWRGFMGFFGVDPSAYNAMFPDNIEVLQGHFLSAGETGIMLPDKIYQELLTKVKVKYDAGRMVKILSMGSGTKIMNLPIAGVFRFKTNNNTMQEVGFMDLASLRYMLDMVQGAGSQIKIADQDQDMLSASADSLDSFFGADSSIAVAKPGSTGQLSNADLNHILGDTSRRAELAKADAGAWHYVLLRVKAGVDPQTTITALNHHFQTAGVNLVAIDWEEASGSFASFITAAQIFFLVLVLIISFVSVIVIMNTMVVSIIERTGEIGTMRALGAPKSFVRQVFMAETFTLSVVGGSIGLLTAGILIAVLNQVGLPAPQYLFELLFGGKILYPVLSWTSALEALVIMMLVGLVSSLYPTAIALRISPISAMQGK